MPIMEFSLKAVHDHHVCGNSRATVNVGIKKILLYSSHLGPSVEDWVLVNNITVVIYW